QIEALETEQKIIEREKSVGIDVTEREARVALALETARARRSQRESEWAGEKALVERILTLRAQLRGGSAAVDKASEDVARPAEAEADRITQTG
ncbi:type VI secretion system ATPase TssH, partial [bacterium M00.F.Ca.ET.229.01.1.1]